MLQHGVVLPFLVLVAVANSGAASGLEMDEQDQAANSEDIVVERKKEPDNLDEVVCKTEKVVGSRLSRQKRCQTKRQWQAERSANRQDLEKAQSARWKSN